MLGKSVPRGVSEMQAQQRNARKNYISTVSDMAEQQAASVAKFDDAVEGFLAAVMAVLKWRRETGS
jgi:hypothetical protein